MLTMLSHPEDINIERCQTPPTLGGMDVNTRLAYQAVKRAESRENRSFNTLYRTSKKHYYGAPE